MKIEISILNIIFFYGKWKEISMLLIFHVLAEQITERRMLKIYFIISLVI